MVPPGPLTKVTPPIIKLKLEDRIGVGYWAVRKAILILNSSETLPGRAVLRQKLLCLEWSLRATAFVLIISIKSNFSLKQTNQESLSRHHYDKFKTWRTAGLQNVS